MFRTKNHRLEIFFSLSDFFFAFLGRISRIRTQSGKLLLLHEHTASFLGFERSTFEVFKVFVPHICVLEGSQTTHPKGNAVLRLLADKKQELAFTSIVQRNYYYYYCHKKRRTYQQNKYICFALFMKNIN